jgi:putative transposase
MDWVDTEAIASRQLSAGLLALAIDRWREVLKGRMVRMKRHTEYEIAAKLIKADALVAEGQTQDAIAQALGISVMTFHRWRKARPRALRAKSADALKIDTQGVIAQSLEPEHGNRYAELELENLRLRKLVTDLLLEKMKLEHEWQQNSRHSAASKVDAHLERTR